MAKNLQNNNRRCERGSRNLNVLLYPDSISYDCNEVIEKIMSLDCKFYMCTHVPEEESKKEHIHCVLVFQNTKTISAVSKILGIEDNYIQYCDNLRDSIRYLIHLDSPTKIQYSNDSIVSNASDTLDKYLDISKDESLIVCEFLSKLDEGYSFRKLLKFACENGYYSVFRRNFNILHTIVIDERK